MNSASHIRMIVFDMAGTTVFDEDHVTRAFQSALGDFDIHPTRGDVNEVMGYPKPEAIRVMLESAGRSAEKADVAEIHDRFLDIVNTFYREDDSVREMEGASDVFRFLQARGIRVALDTGFSRPTAQIIIDRFNWMRDGLVNDSVTSDEVPRGRPHADMIGVLMERAGIVDVSEVAKVGDTPSDLLEGHTAGCGWNIGVLNGSHTAEELAPHPHTHLLPSIVDIPALFETVA